MSKYSKGDHVKIDISDPASQEHEWAWLLVEACDDGTRIVFGKLDNEPIANTDLKLGQRLAVSFDRV